MKLRLVEQASRHNHEAPSELAPSCSKMHGVDGVEVRARLCRLYAMEKCYCRDHLGLDPDRDDSIRLGRCGPSDEHTLPRGHHGLFHDGSSECAVVFVLHVSPEHVGLARHPNHVGPLIPIDWRSLPPVGIVVPEAPASIITTGRLNGPLAGNPHWGCHTSWDLTSDARPRTRWASGSRLLLLTSGPRSCDPVNLQEAPLPALYDCQPRSCLILATLRLPSDFDVVLKFLQAFQPPRLRPKGGSKTLGTRRACSIPAGHTVQSHANTVVTPSSRRIEC